MFTKRSVLVGLLVLAAARLLNGAVQTPPSPPSEGYWLYEDLQDELYRLGADTALQLTNVMTVTRSLGTTAFHFRTVNPSPSAFQPELGSEVAVDLVAADWETGPGKGVLVRLSYDALDPANGQSTLCEFTGETDGGETGFAADVIGNPPGLPSGPITSTPTLLAAVGSPGADRVDLFHAPPSTADCDLLATYTDTRSSLFGLGVEVTGPLPKPLMWISRAGTQGDPDSRKGGLDVYLLDVDGARVEAFPIDGIDGDELLDLYPTVLGEWCGVPSDSSCSLLVGRPFRTSPSSPVVSAYTVFTSTISHLGSVAVSDAASLGKCVSAAGDLDDDDVPDIWACADDRLLAFSGKELLDSGGGVVNGPKGVIHDIPAPVSGTGFPHQILGGFDYDGDGVPDVAASAPDFSSGPTSSVGAVYLFDGATGKLLDWFQGTDEGDRLGGSLNPFILFGDVGPQDRVPELGIVATGHITDTHPVQNTDTTALGPGDIFMVPSTDLFPLTFFKSLLEPLLRRGERVTDEPTSPEPGPSEPGSRESPSPEGRSPHR